MNPVPQKQNEVWSAGIMRPDLYTLKPFYLLTVFDTFTRICIAFELIYPVSGRRLIEIFSRLQKERGLPQTLCMAIGHDFMTKEFVAWARTVGMTLYCGPSPYSPNVKGRDERIYKTLIDKTILHEQGARKRVDNKRGHKKDPTQ